MANDWRKLVDQVIELQKDPDMDTSPAPSLQWFPQQWLGDAAVQLMTMPARGCHHHLLMTAWKGFDLDDDAVPCSLPDDPDLLGAICQNPDGWAEVWSQVRRAWKVHEGRVWNVGLIRSYLRQMEKRRKAKGSAAARWRKDDPIASETQCADDANACSTDANALHGDANASATQCSSASSSASAPSPEEKNPQKDSSCPAEPGDQPRRTKEGHFDVWWARYPKKTGRKEALAKWKAIPREQMPSAETVIAFIEKAEATARWKNGYVKDGNRFVEKRVWEDDLSAYASNNGDGPGHREGGRLIRKANEAEIPAGQPGHYSQKLTRRAE